MPTGSEKGVEEFRSADPDFLPRTTLPKKPTVDHVEASASAASFKICAWRTNDAKNDLTVEGFLALCARVLAHAGYRVEPPEQERAA
jgi:hypothetical protein